MSMPILIHKPIVDREWVGLARQLRNKVGETAGPAKQEINRLIGPLKPMPRFTPMPRKKYLEYMLKRWEGLPEIGRLSAFAAYQDSKLRRGELRACPSRLRYRSWQDGDFEPSISILET